MEDTIRDVVGCVGGTVKKDVVLTSHYSFLHTSAFRIYLSPPAQNHNGRYQGHQELLTTLGVLRLKDRLS